jgi:IS1 family transposase
MQASNQHSNRVLPQLTGVIPMANVLKRERQLLVLKMLVDGASIRAVSRVTDVDKDAVIRLLVRFGEGCQRLLDSKVRRVNARHLEVDEQWTYCGKKQARCSDAEKQSGEVGDQYLYLAIDQDTKLIACHTLGKRNEETTRTFMAKLANRIVLSESVHVDHNDKPQLSTDGFGCYPGAIQDVFGSYVQHGVIVKNYVNPEVGRYAPPEIKDCDRRRVQYVDDLMTICTSHAERFNCTTRMFVKRFCRLTLAFSKKLRNLKAAIALHIAYYNFVWRSRENDGQRTGRKRLPAAMQAGIVDTLWTMEDLYDAVMAA